MWREHGEGSRLDLADVFTDSAGEGGCAWSLLSLSWNLLVSWSLISVSLRTEADPRPWPLARKYEQPSCRRVSRHSLGVGAEWTATGRLTSWPPGFQHLQVPPRLCCFP